MSMKQTETNDFYLIYIVKKIRPLVTFLISKWLVIGLVAVIFGVLGILYAWYQKPSYTAELVFSSEGGSESALGGYAGLAAQFGFDLGMGTGGAFEGDNLIELLKTYRIVKETLLSDAKNFGSGKLMIDAYIQNHKVKKKSSDGKDLSTIRFTKTDLAPNRDRDSVMKAVYKSIVEDKLSIEKKDKKLNYIVVKMKDVNEVFAKDFAQMLVNNATRYYIEYKS